MENRADATFRATLQAVAGTAMLFAAGALVRYGADAAISTLVGGGVAILNLLAMRKIFGNVIAGAAEGDLRKGKGWGTLAVLKLFALFVGVALLLIRGVADPVPFIVGYIALPVGVVVGGLLVPPKDDDPS